jgi:DNA polymerase III delta subunit
MQKFASFVSSVERRRQPGYVLAGPEGFLRDEAESVVVRAVLGDDPGTGLVVLDGGREGAALEAADVLDEARTVTLLGGKKVICVRRADTIVKGSADAFAAYLGDPDPESTLVVHVEGWDRRTAAARKLDRWAVDCGSLYETEFGSQDISANSALGGWVASRASSRQLGLDAEAIVRLVELVGTNLAEIEGALDRLAVAAARKAAGKGGALGVSDIDEIVAPSRAYTVFRVAELAASGRRREALAAAEACFEQGLPGKGGRATLNESAIAARLQWAIARELETLYAARGLLNEGSSVRRDFSKIGVPKHRADQVDRTVRAVPQEMIERALGLTLASEWHVKRGDADARSAVERLVLELGA